MLCEVSCVLVEYLPLSSIARLRSVSKSMPRVLDPMPYCTRSIGLRRNCTLHEVLTRVHRSKRCKGCGNARARPLAKRTGQPTYLCRECKRADLYFSVVDRLYARARNAEINRFTTRTLTRVLQHLHVVGRGPRGQLMYWKCDVDGCISRGASETTCK